MKLEFEQAFMMYLPRICEHCVNPSCVASCPSGAMYKREEDGIVLVDQEACRSWRFCVSGCPYKKVYFNWDTGKAEKCTFCYPRHRGRDADRLLGDLRRPAAPRRASSSIDTDRVEEAASVPDEQELLDSQLDLLLDPDDPEVREQARADGIPEDWLEAASRSPVYAMCKRWRIALPLHPEYRTLPMVWYVPPLSPVESLGESLVRDGGDPDAVFAAIEELRIPVAYLANFLSAGDPEPVRRSLRRLVAMRRHMRERNLGGEPDPGIAREVGMEPARAGGDVPAGRDRRLRRALRDPEAPRRGLADRLRRAGLLRDRLRQRRRAAAGDGPPGGRRARGGDRPRPRLRHSRPAGQEGLERCRLSPSTR